MTNLVILLFLNATFFVWYVTCPSSSPKEKIQLLARFRKVIVRNYESGIIHVYNNAGIYSIKRPIWVRLEAPYLSWYTIRGRKSPDENFRTLLDMCGLEIELILFTDQTVKMIVDNKYEYTLTFEMAHQAESFSNVLYHAVIEFRGRNKVYPLDEILIKQNDDNDDNSDIVLESPVWLYRRNISDELIVYYATSNTHSIKMIFSSKHFTMESSAPLHELSLTLMIVRGIPLDYTYIFTFYEMSDFVEFLAIAVDQEFKNEPDAEPEDTGYSDMLTDHQFYDADELAYFWRMENGLSWDV